MTRNLILFGYDDAHSPRTHTVLAAFKREGFGIVKCRTAKKGFAKKILDLLGQWNRIRKSEIHSGAHSHALVLIPFPAHFLVPLAWLLTRFPRRKLVADMFVSLYESDVEDRKVLSALHPLAWMKWALDWVCCHAPDEVLVDTKANAHFIAERFHADVRRIRVVYLEARTDLFRTHIPVHPITETQTFDVFFYGTYIPLQGIEYILQAASLLQKTHPKVRFTMAGSGQTRSAMNALALGLALKNVTFLPSVPLEDLPPLIAKAHLCLGIFGTSPKAARVIPHKVVDAVAMGKPVLTRDSPAIRERFAEHPLVMTCKPGNPEDMAKKIAAFAARAGVTKEP